MSESCLYIVATPIGNLNDLSPRARDVLAQVDVIAAEDTRHTSRLLNHFGIRGNLVACHDHNERSRSEQIVQRLQGGESVALVSDAGTPLISDPGYHLVNAVREAGIKVVPVPGACAMVSALSVSGLPSDRFFFEGFLPAKGAGRRKRLAELSDFPHTWIVYESPHRIMDMLVDMDGELGGDRKIVLARELTKTFETVLSGTVSELQEILTSDENQRRGEFVVLIHGAEKQEGFGDDIPDEALKILEVLVEELPMKQASQIASKITGIKSKLLYKAGLAMKE
ncbi:16S rRNA (cytidine(1402)-2'-O)-methyltransferase [Sansalvadorimonas sp. 2012CJ34-2]|uniref:Ribosomal RNA small subunit methyltransferase I n=1 Tax=Parendozoicomonas callyspongiae TaxID=2942213 RepID=A0ABT0PCN5_9GAMM|nr:16S rRNA (cytidine(1402)-2'-O)-methyltransferase [Sansalvadorimonas sp. 2012CJ34-2]MCL6268981.1 16S rRNA (cytidine(1402)-2'-O)-methyltransferase [Sansalvadorimonas sp. 2012CJ34-2]